jgi:hypothetical protein
LVQIPYGYIFSNLAGVVDFLLSYGEYLASQGLSFTAQENGYTLNWLQMAQEFLYFANQGWATGTIINLEPIGHTGTGIPRRELCWIPSQTTHQKI